MSSGSSKNQTASFLRKRFREAGIEPRTRYGQNFLTDLNLVRLLVRAAQPAKGELVLEVGTGTGSLTALLAETGARVLTVEIDPQMFQLASEELHSLANVRMLYGDVLATKNRFDATFLATLAEELAAQPGCMLKLAANLPYNVATPILSNFLALDRPPETMTVTLQKELADRLIAVPATKDYGALSVWVQSQCRVEVVRALPPTVFWPKPKVHSAIVHLTVDASLRNRIADRGFFHEFVRAMFCHRRKFLRSELRTACQDRLDKPAVDEILAAEGLDGQQRAEHLSVEQFLSLAKAVRRRLGS